MRRRTTPCAVTPYPYQVVGSEWLAAHPTAFLGDDMGVGKSLQAIRAADQVEARSILVVAPTNAIYNWQNEFVEHSLYERTVQVIDKGGVKALTGEVVIVTHGLIRNPWLRHRLSARVWDVVIVDEAHAFKSPDAERTRALYGEDIDGGHLAVVKNARRTWLLSGTPVPNNASELWTHLRALRPDLIVNPNDPYRTLTADEFARRYCVVIQGLYGPKILGNRKDQIAEIREHVIKPFVLRRMLADVLPDLPPIRYDLTLVPPTKVTDDLRALERELDDEIRAFLADLDSDADPVEVLKRFSSHEGEKAGGLARLRRLTGHLKVTGALNLLTEHFATPGRGKVIVFGWHTAVIGAIRDACAGAGWQPAFVDGSVSAANRQAEVDRFQKDAACRVFVGQLQACSTAATLTAASDVIFAESSWVPSDNAQGAARARRIGQKRHVRVQFLALAGSIDEAVMRVLVRKVQTIKELLA